MNVETSNIPELQTLNIERHIVRFHLRKCSRNSILLIMLTTIFCGLLNISRSYTILLQTLIPHHILCIHIRIRMKYCYVFQGLITKIILNEFPIVNFFQMYMGKYT